MQPILYKKIARLIKTKGIKSLTVDIFDTILLNDYWPAALRNYDLARKWALDIYRITTLNLSTYELFDLYEAAEQELTSTNTAPRLDIALDIMLDAICRKHSITLTSDERLNLLAAMIATSLQFTINNTRPNHNLIAQIANLKQVYPDLKVYFLVDSCFCAAQIKTMLEILSIKIFDDGITSSDLNSNKANGTIYEQLSAEFGANFDLMYNLHLGDHRIPDYLMPILHDSYAIHYRPVRMRGLRTLVGRTAMNIIRFRARQQERSDFEKIHSGIALGDDWKEYGTIKAEWQELWSWQIATRAQLCSEQNYLLTKDLSTLAIANEETANIISSELNQELVIKAFIWLLATFDTTRWNAPKLLQLIAETTEIKERGKLYQLCFGRDAVFSELALQSYSENEFYQELLNEVKNGDSELSKELHHSYDTVLQYLPRDEKNLCVVVRNSDHTTMLLREFAKLHGVGNEISEWILDSDGNFHHAEVKLTPQLNARRRERTKRGAQNAAALLRHTRLNPQAYLNQILKPRLKRVAKSL